MSAKFDQLLEENIGLFEDKQIAEFALKEFGNTIQLVYEN